MAQIKNCFTGEVIAEGGAVRQALQKAIERGADLRDADLRYAYLRGAYLRDAKLRGADLRDAYLRDANLRGAKLRGADLGGATLCGASLNGAKGVVTSGTSPRGHSHWAWIKSGAIVYRAGCKEFYSPDDYRAYYSAAGYAESHGALSAAVSLALCEMNIDLAGKLLDQQEAA
jgi:uncharacterized protein YjbI with pentapeptide repeats